MPSNKSRPVAGAPVRPSNERNPATGAPVLKQAKVPVVTAQRVQHGTPSFRFNRMDFDGPYSWHNAKKVTWLKILKNLSRMETMSRSECGKHGSHALEIWGCCKNARDRFCELRLDAHYEEVFSVRIEGQMRVICLDHWPVLDILWFDPGHDVWPAEKKHT